MNSKIKRCTSTIDRVRREMIFENQYTDCLTLAIKILESYDNEEPFDYDKAMDVIENYYGIES